jgi:ATP-dependent helicase HrpA
MRITITDPTGKVLRSGRDRAVLSALAEAPPRASDDFAEICRAWERPAGDTWDFGDLPENLSVKGPDDPQWNAYPCLEARAQEVMLTLKADSETARRAHSQGVKALLLRRFGPDLKFLKKNLQLSAAFDPHCRYFGGRAAVEAKLLQRVLDDAMAKNIRTAQAFATLTDRIETTGFASLGQEMRHGIMAVLTAYQQTRAVFSELETTHHTNPKAQAFLSELREKLEALVPNHFVLLYDAERLNHLLRYLKALGVRAQRGVLNPEKDHAKARQVDPYDRQLTQLAQALNERSSSEKRKAVEDLFWMIEEYKISLFAQEIGTAHPISTKRLDAQRQIIDLLL